MADLPDFTPEPICWLNVPPLVTRKEYDELFLAITRLTDRIEALEKDLLGDGR